MRLARIHAALVARAGRATTPADVEVCDLPNTAVSAGAAQISRLAAGLRVADRGHPPFNLTIAFVAGPAEPLYTAGGELKAILPALAVNDGAGLAIAGIGYRERLDLCAVSCRELVPDLSEFGDDLVAAFEELRTTPLSPVKDPARPRLRTSRPLRERSATT